MIRIINGCLKTKISPNIAFKKCKFPSIAWRFNSYKSESEDDTDIEAEGRRNQIQLHKKSSANQAILRSYLDILKYVPVSDSTFFGNETKYLELSKSQFDVFFPLYIF